MFNTKESTIFSPKKQGSRLFLLLSGATDANLVVDMLDGDYEIVTDPQSFESASFDLLIVDEPQFRKHRNMYDRLKREALPVMLPVLMLTNNSGSLRGDGKMLEIVDDILSVPTSPEVLSARVKLLLKTRRYSKQLQKEKKKYQLLAENSTDMISTHTIDGEYTYVSPASQHLLGYRPSELVGKNVMDFIREEDCRFVQSDRESIFTEKEPRKMEFRKKTKSGEYKWVESVIKSLDMPGDQKILQASTRDISERKRYEQKLEEEIEFIDASLDFLPNIFFMLDDELNYIRWNQNLTKNLGYKSSEIQEMSPYDFVKRDAYPLVRDKLEEVLITGKAEMEVDLITKAGKRIRHRISAQKYESGDDMYILGTCVDISQQHQMMNDLKASNEEKKVLLQEIHHRVKNNLAVISGMLELQAMESEDPELGQKLKDSQFRIQSMASVHELLYRSQSFSRINMRTYLNELISKIRETSRLEKEIAITRRIDPIELNINQAIPCSLIANELITNAFKHAFQGKADGNIAIELHEDSGKVYLVIEDDGRGLSKDIDLEQPHSLGIKLVKVLKAQLEADLDIRSENGAIFVLSFEKKNRKGSATNFTH